MESTLVIKVKNGDTLRRFNTYVGLNGELGLNVEKLREKMRSLFNLSVDDEFTLTYTDTDGDSVTLVDDFDLDDVVLQCLNPVRMTLTLKSGQKSSTESLGINFSQSIEQIQTSVEKVVETLPEPLREVFMKLTRVLATTTTTASAPVVVDILNSASKIGESFAGEGYQSFSQEENVETKVSNEDVEGKVKEVDSKRCHVPDLNHAPPPPSEFSDAAAYGDNCGNRNGKREMCSPMLVNGRLSVDIKQYSRCPMFSKARPDMRVPTFVKGDRRTQFKRSHSHSDNVAPVIHAGVQCDACGVHPITGPRFKSKVKHDYDLCSPCYQKSGCDADYVRIDAPMRDYHIMKAFHRKHGGSGPRSQAPRQFKPVSDPFVSFTLHQAKLDSQFIVDVTVVDGTLMAPSTPFTKIWRMRNNGNVGWPVGTQLGWIDGDKFSNALSVDLVIPRNGVPVDGLIDVAIDFVAPELPGEYVSYWRMSSASGQKFGQRVWVAIQVYASPDPLNASLSNLNLNMPPQSNDQNHPVVVEINGVIPMSSTFSPSNLYPAEAPVKTSSVKAVDLLVTADSPPIESVIQAVSGKVPVEDNDMNEESQRASSETMGNAFCTVNEQDANFPINDFLLVGDAVSNGTAPLNVPSVSYPIVGSFKIEAGAIPVSAYSSIENLEPLPQSEVFNETEESLLKQLIDMGFSLVDLNRAILRKNAYDMEKTVVDLWDISEWDPIMDELEEMGFSDKKKNAILLVKNKGSIKRVVMDLVAGDMAQ